MRPRQSLYKFLFAHLPAVVLSLMVHVVIAGLFVFHEEFDLAPYLAKVIPQTRPSSTATKQDQPVTRNIQQLLDEDDTKIIETQVTNSQLIEKQIAQIRQRKQAVVQAEKDRIKKVQKELKAVSKKRALEQSKIDVLRSQQSTLQGELKTLIEQKKDSAKALKQQEQQALQASEKLAEIAEQELQAAEQLKRLRDLQTNAKQNNQKLIEEAIANQRRLEQLRIQEEIKAQQAAENRRQLEQQAQQEQQRIVELQEQGEQRKQLLEQSLSELSSIQQTQIAKLKSQYVRLIRTEVRSNWRYPFNKPDDWYCEISVQQSPTGAVESVNLQTCSADSTEQFQESIIKAVYRSDPLPQPPDKKVFESVITFRFTP